MEKYFSVARLLFALQMPGAFFFENVFCDGEMDLRVGTVESLSVCKTIRLGQSLCFSPMGCVCILLCFFCIMNLYIEFLR
jgi:hypothetical protein